MARSPRRNGRAQADADARLERRWPSLEEAQVAALADDIAYDNHDIDDGLRAGLLTLDQIDAVPLVARGWKDMATRFPDLPRERLAGELIRSQIGAMVNDLIARSTARIAASGVRSVDDVRGAGRALIAFSDGMAADERLLKRFMYANLYHHHASWAAGAARACGGSGNFTTIRADPAAAAGWRDPYTCPPKNPRSAATSPISSRG